MDEEQIFEAAIRELTESALNARRENLPGDETEVYLEIERLSKQTVLNKCKIVAAEYHFVGNER